MVFEKKTGRNSHLSYEYMMHCSLIRIQCSQPPIYILSVWSHRKRHQPKSGPVSFPGYDPSVRVTRFSGGVTVCHKSRLGHLIAPGYVMVVSEGSWCPTAATSVSPSYWVGPARTSGQQGIRNHTQHALVYIGMQAAVSYWNLLPNNNYLSITIHNMSLILGSITFVDIARFGHHWFR